MSVTTVTGPIDQDQLGIILPHEHLLIDLRNQYTQPSDSQAAEIGRQKVQMSNLGLLRRNPYAIEDNLVLDDVDLAVFEIGFFKKAGGATVVDCTSIGINRNVIKLKQIAERTGLNVIAGCGYYTHDTHPADMPNRTPEQIADEMVSDLTIGVDGTDICAGVIGEIGVSNPIDPQETKNLIASALAHRRTNAPIQVHTYMWGRCGIDATKILTDNGADPSRIVICHTDVCLDVDYIVDLLKMGVYIQFDNFGKEFYIKRSERAFAGGSFASDIERVRAIKMLIDSGYGSRLLAANDICLKQMLRTYGGWGYDHVLTNIVPMMLDEDIHQSDVDKLFRDNPRKWLTGMN